MQGVWAACDVFWDFDRDRTGFVTRKEYIQRLGDAPSVERVRVLRRANLSQRFRGDASPVSLTEMLRLCWPSATAEDHVTMRRWVELRDAYHMFINPNFRGSDLDMRRSFELLGTGGDCVVASQLVRALVLGSDDACSLARTQRLRRHQIDWLEWKERWWPALRATYVTRETIAKMRREEESAAAGDFTHTLRAELRSSLMGSGGAAF